MTGETGSPAIPREAPWTDEQWDAITTRHRNLLVSAAAGAGKTAVLVRRVIFLLTHPTDPVDIDRLLVVTFTDAAAAEMRDRISKALEKELDSKPESARLARQLALVSKADISTLHSFCHKMIRQYFYRLGIDPAFRAMDDVENQLLQLEVIDDLFEDCYDDIDFEEAFTDIVDRYGGGRGDENVKDLVLRVYNFSRSRPDPDEWLSGLSSMFSISANAGIRDLPWTGLALQGISRKVQMAYRSLGQAVEIAGVPSGPGAYAELLRDEFEACSRILKACKDEDWESIAQLLNELEFPTLPGIKRGSCDDRLKVEAQAGRNEAKKILRGLKDECFSRSPQDLVDDIRAIAPSMQTFIRVVKGFDKAYQAAKREKSLVDFADMEHLCLKVLREWDDSKGEWVKSDVAKELQDRYREVLVDEYQDINPVQNEILHFVSSHRNSFMVGDVKQSIYRFRLAEPTLFMDKHKEFPKGDTASDNKRIDLSRNFRSRKTVIDSVNFIFRQVFSQGVGEIDYDKWLSGVPLSCP
jgi:ATP-dependent helicase/nuclease subunit A